MEEQITVHQKWKKRYVHEKLVDLQQLFCVPEEIIEKTEKHILETRKVGYSLDVQILAVLYYNIKTSRECEPITRKHFLEKGSKQSFQFNKSPQGFNKLYSELCFQKPKVEVNVCTVRPTIYARKLIEKFEVPKEVEEQIIFYCREIVLDHHFSGLKPSAVATAIFYVITRINNISITQRQLVEEMDTNEPALRQITKKICVHFSELNVGLKHGYQPEFFNFMYKELRKKYGKKIR